MLWPASCRMRQLHFGRSERGGNVYFEHHNVVRKPVRQTWGWVVSVRGRIGCFILQSCRQGALGKNSSSAIPA
jgi:hypothetical protein